MHKITTADYFDMEASTWSERYRERRQFKDRLQTVVGWIKDYPSKCQILDYGCGSGDLITILATNKHITTGVDISASMLKAAEASLNKAGVSADHFKLEQVQTDGTAVALFRNYDVVISLGVLEYLDDPAAVLEKLARTLNPGGFLIISVPNRSSLLRVLEKLIARFPAPFRRLGLFKNLTNSDSYLNFQKHQFHLKDLEKSLNRFGLRRRRFFYHAGLPSFLSGLEKRPILAMTVIAEFQKTGVSPNITVAKYV